MIRSIIRAVLPQKTRYSLLKWYRFTLGFSRFRKQNQWSNTPNHILEDIAFGWGNTNYSASPDFLRAAFTRLEQSSGPILECGSGLSTFLLGFVAQKLGKSVITLENNEEWAEKVSLHLKRHKINSVKIYLAKLTPYESYDWYDTAKVAFDAKFDTVLCDGPPGRTRGGRYGLLPRMYAHLSSDCVILLDDVGRAEDKSVANQWIKEFNWELVVENREKPYGILTRPKGVQISNPE